MDQQEKRRLRETIGAHLDVSNTRLTDDDALILAEFIRDYGQYRGREETHTSTRPGWGSDGKYTLRETTTHTFTDEIGIRQDYEYQDDDGVHRSSSTMITDAREVLNYLKSRV